MIWRYMRPERFADLLRTSALFLSPAACMEPDEGSSPDANFWADMSFLRQKFRSLMFLNCWHMSEHQSAAMWRLYASGKGVAIRTTFQALRDSIVDDRTFDVWFTKVRYIDYATEAFEGNIAESDCFTPFMYKQKMFEYERELRIIAPYPALEGVETDPGIFLAVDLDALLQGIAIAPYADAPAIEALQKTLGRFGRSHFKIEQVPKPKF